MKDLEKMELLKQAWKEIFEVEDVADDADFFEDGGDSIKAVQLSSWLLQKGLKLDLGKIFYTPVLSQMAETLEETDPVYIPDELVTKDLVGSKINDIMKNMYAGGKSAPAPAAAPVKNEQICDPDSMPKRQGGNDQICDPNAMPKMQGGNEQICDPNAMPKMRGGNEQICDPNAMPKRGGYPGTGQNFVAPFVPQIGFAQQANDPTFAMMTTMFQTLLQQQQVMLQMMQVMLTRMAPPVQSFFPSFPVQNPPKNMKPHVPEEAKEALRKQMEKYKTHTVEKPIEKPNLIGIKPAKVTKPEYSAEEVLDHVLSGLLKNGYDKTKDLFEQGLTSLDTVKMVTRCGEHGYSLSMQDIFMKSTFEELVKCMKPGE